MKKKSKATIAADAPSSDGGRSTFLRRVIEEFAKEKGGGAYLVSDQALIPIGIPFPAFVLEYLFGCTVLPFSRIYQIVGLQGTVKSALTVEIARWFRALSGEVLYLEHESKFNPDYARSILGWDDPQGMTLLKCHSINDWQRKLQAAVRLAKEDAKERGSKAYPVLFIVDSITAKAMEETQEKIEKEGFASRGFPAEALSITRFMRQIPQQLDEWPFVLLLVNHLKPNRNDMGIVERHKAGGRGVDFQESCEIELSKHREWRLKRVNRTGRKYNIQLHKNALGPDMRTISVEVWWWFEDVADPATGESSYRQVTVWDWHAATVQFLANPPDEYRRRTKEIISFDTVQKREGMCVISPELGITAKDPLTPSEAGAMLAQREDILCQLRRLYGISQWKPYQPQVDYDQQLAAEKRRASPPAPDENAEPAVEHDE